MWIMLFWFRNLTWLVSQVLQWNKAHSQILSGTYIEQFLLLKQSISYYTWFLSDIHLSHSDTQMFAFLCKTLPCQFNLLTSCTPRSIAKGGRQVKYFNILTLTDIQIDLLYRENTNASITQEKNLQFFLITSTVFPNVGHF